MRYRGLIVMILAISLAACATATPYQPLKGGYGYQDQKLENNRYRVSFTGNSDTSRSTVEDYLLYRAAQLTLKTGNDYFVTAQRNTERSTHYVNTYNNFGYSPFFYNPYFYDPFFYTPPLANTGTSYPVNHYRAYAMIIVHKGKKPADNIHAYSAREVIHNLGPEVEKDKSKK